VFEIYIIDRITCVTSRVYW